MLRRCFDLVLSSVFLAVAAPLMLVTAGCVALDGGSVFYRQPRVGLKGQCFQILKFRSMSPNNLTTAQLVEAYGHGNIRPPEVTFIGRWIRRFKIDELPQLLNVLHGEMSMIGPRPTVPEQVLKYSDYERRRLDVLPGLTGWAQVNGGIEYEWPERLLLDVWYVDHRDPWLDLEILCRTAWVVVFGERCDPRALEKAQQYFTHTTTHGGKKMKGTECSVELSK